MNEAEKVICPTDTDTEFKPAFLLSSIRLVNPTSLYQNAELM